MDVPAIRWSREALLAAAGSDSPAAAARFYAALGFSVIPLRGKVPAVAWRSYQVHRASAEEISGWIRRGLFRNVGLVCGPASGGLVVLDLDGEAAYRTFIRRFPLLAGSYTVATGGGHGYHVYFRTARLPRTVRAIGTRAGNFELRSSGHQVVAPPSRHPDTGRLYWASRSLDVLSVPNLDELAGWIGSLKARRPIYPEPCHDAYRDAGRLKAALAEHFRMRGYRQRREWLNGPCIYPERHKHRDCHPSFGYNTRSGYGYCFVCGSMPAGEMARRLSLPVHVRRPDPVRSQVERRQAA